MRRRRPCRLRLLKVPAFSLPPLKVIVFFTVIILYHTVPCKFLASLNYLKSIVSVRSAPAPNTQPSTIIFFFLLSVIVCSLYCNSIIAFRSLQIPCRCFDFSRFYQMTPATLRYVNTIPPTAATAAILNNTICISLLSFGFVPLAVFT